MKNIFIPDQEKLNQKINQIKKDGVANFHIVSDFDRTLTPAVINGEKPTTSFALIRRGGYLGKEYLEKAERLFEHYYPIETNDDLSIAERCGPMTEWWEAHLGLMVEYGLTKEMILDIVSKRKMSLRKGSEQFIDFLTKHNIPLLIFSAGIGDLIKEYLSQHKELYKNIHIISNLFEFDEKGRTTGFTKPVIHPFNKNEGQIRTAPYHNQIQNRKNVLLLGNTLGDSSMLAGLSHETIIKIGFLNENVDKFKDAYAKEYDVLILNDGTLEYVNDLLKHIL